MKKLVLLLIAPLIFSCTKPAEVTVNTLNQNNVSTKTVSVAYPMPTIQSAINVPINLSPSINGGQGPFKLSISPVLPDGVMFDPSSGLISGSFKTAIDQTYEIVVIDSLSDQATTSLHLVVTNQCPVQTTPDSSGNCVSQTQELALSYPAMGNQINGAVLDLVPSSSGGIPPYLFTAQNLPNGLSINVATGEITGTLSDTITPGIGLPVNIIVTMSDSSILNPQSITKQVTFNETTCAAGTVLDPSSNSCQVSLAALNVQYDNPNYSFVQNVTIDLLPSVSGGSGQYNFAISPDITQPSYGQLSFDQTTGAISGTASALINSQSFVLTVTDSLGHMASTNLVLSVNALQCPNNYQVSNGTCVQISKLTLLYPSGLNYLIGTSVNLVPTVIGGTGPYTYTASNVPSGFKFSTSSGVLKGSFTTVFSDLIVITVKDSTGTTATATVNLAGQTNYCSNGYVLNSSGTCTQFVYTTSINYPNHNSASVIAGQGLDLLPQISGGLDPFQFTVKTGTLLSGLTINSSTGEITGTVDPTTPAGIYTYTISVVDQNTLATGDNSSVVLTINVNTCPTGFSLNSVGVCQQSNPGLIVVASNKTFYTGVADQLVPTVSGGVPPYQFSITPLTLVGISNNSSFDQSSGLPIGLVFDSTTGIVSGTISGSVESESYTISVTDSIGEKASTQVSISAMPACAQGFTYQNQVCVQSIANLQLVYPNSSALVGGSVDTFPSIVGGVAPYSFSASLPSGLVINSSTGEITGSISATTNPGVSSYPITVTDQTNTKVTANWNLTLTSCPTNFHLQSGNCVQNTSALSVNYPVIYTFKTGIAGKIIPQVLGGSAPYSFKLDSGSTLPSGLVLDANTGIISGTLVSTIPPEVVSIVVSDYSNQSVNATINIGTVNACGSNYSLIGGVCVQNLSPIVASYNPVIALLGTKIDVPINISGGQAPYVFIMDSSNALTTGLSLNTSTGEISGVPQLSSGQYTYLVDVVDLNNNRVQVSVSLNLTDCPVGYQINTSLNRCDQTASSLALFYPGTVQTFTGSSLDLLSGISGGVAPYQLRIEQNPPTGYATSLPSGLVLNSSTGEITGSANYLGNTKLRIDLVDANNSLTSADITIIVDSCPQGYSFDQASNTCLFSFNQLAISYTNPNQTVYVGSSISIVPVVSGGSGKYKYSISPDLTTLSDNHGLSFNASTGELSSASITDMFAQSFTVTVIDTGLNQSSNATLSLTATGSCANNYSLINSQCVPNLSVTYTDQSAVIGSSMDIIPQIFGGVGPYSFTSSPLPAGLVLNPSTGEITGSPLLITNGKTGFSVMVSDSSGLSINQVTTTLNLNISNCPVGYIVQNNSCVLTMSPLTISYNSTNTLNFPQGKYFEAVPIVSGGTGKYYFTISPTTLPSGISLDPNTGRIYGTTNDNLNNLSYSVTISDGNNLTSVLPKQITLTLDIVSACPSGFTLNSSGACTNLPSLSLNYPTSVTYIVGQNFELKPVVINGIPTSYSVTAGTLPNGLVLNTSTGEISGTPLVMLANNTYTSLTITATDGTNSQDSTIEFYSSLSVLFQISYQPPGVIYTGTVFSSTPGNGNISPILPKVSGGIAIYYYSGNCSYTDGTTTYPNIYVGNMGLSVSSLDGSISGQVYASAAGDTYTCPIFSQDIWGRTTSTTVTLSVQTKPVSLVYALGAGTSSNVTSVIDTSQNPVVQTITGNVGDTLNLIPVITNSDNSSALPSYFNCTSSNQSGVLTCYSISSYGVSGPDTASGAITGRVQQTQGNVGPLKMQLGVSVVTTGGQPGNLMLNLNFNYIPENVATTSTVQINNSFVKIKTDESAPGPIQPNPQGILDPTNYSSNFIIPTIVNTYAYNNYTLTSIDPSLTIISAPAFPASPVTPDKMSLNYGIVPLNTLTTRDTSNILTIPSLNKIFTFNNTNLIFTISDLINSLENIVAAFPWNTTDNNGNVILSNNSLVSPYSPVTPGTSLVTTNNTLNVQSYGLNPVANNINIRIEKQSFLTDPNPSPSEYADYSFDDSASPQILINKLTSTQASLTSTPISFVAADYTGQVPYKFSAPNEKYFIINNTAYFFLLSQDPNTLFWSQSLYGYDGTTITEYLRLNTNSSTSSSVVSEFNLGGPNNDRLYFVTNYVTQGTNYTQRVLVEYIPATNQITYISPYDNTNVNSTAISLNYQGNNISYFLTPKGILFQAVDTQTIGTSKNQIYFYNYSDEKNYLLPGNEIQNANPYGYYNYTGQVLGGLDSNLKNIISVDDGILFGTSTGAYYLQYRLDTNNRVIGFNMGKISNTNIQAHYYQSHPVPSSAYSAASYTTDYESCYGLGKNGAHILLACETYGGKGNYKLFDYVYNATNKNGTLTQVLNLNDTYTSDFNFSNGTIISTILGNNSVLFQSYYGVSQNSSDSTNYYSKLYRVSVNSNKASVVQVSNFNGTDQSDSSTPAVSSFISTNNRVYYISNSCIEQYDDDLYSSNKNPFKTITCSSNIPYYGQNLTLGLDHNSNVYIGNQLIFNDGTNRAIDLGASLPNFGINYNNKILWQQNGKMIYLGQSNVNKYYYFDGDSTTYQISDIQVGQLISDTPVNSSFAVAVGNKILILANDTTYNSPELWSVTLPASIIQPNGQY